MQHQITQIQKWPKTPPNILSLAVCGSKKLPMCTNTRCLKRQAPIREKRHKSVLKSIFIIYSICSTC